MAEPEELVRDMLRTRLTDPNSSSRPAGDNYVQADWPQIQNLTLNNYPRVSIIKPGESGKLFGIGSTTMYKNYHLQIDVWTKPEQGFTISGTFYEGKSLAIKISRDIEDALEANWISDLAQPDKFLIFREDNLYTPEIDYEKRYWRQTIDITFEAVKL